MNAIDIPCTETYGNQTALENKICVVVQLYYKNKSIFDFCIDSVQEFCKDIGVSLIVLVPEELHSHYSSLECNVEKYSCDLGFNKNMLQLIQTLRYEYFMVGFDDLFLTNWKGVSLRQVLNDAVTQNVSYLRLSCRPPSLGGNIEIGDCLAKKITAVEVYQASLVYSLIKSSVLQKMLRSFEEPWSIEMKYDMASEQDVYATNLKLIEWKNLLVKSKLDFFEVMYVPNYKELMVTANFERVYDLKRHIKKVMSKLLCIVSPRLYHFLIK